MFNAAMQTNHYHKSSSFETVGKPDVRSSVSLVPYLPTIIEFDTYKGSQKTLASHMIICLPIYCVNKVQQSLSVHL